MEIIKLEQTWFHKSSKNEIVILKNLGGDKWWVRGKMGEYKIRSNMIIDNYKLKKEE